MYQRYLFKPIPTHQFSYSSGVKGRKRKYWVKAFCNVCAASLYFNDAHALGSWIREHAQQCPY